MIPICSALRKGILPRGLTGKQIIKNASSILCHLPLVAVSASSKNYFFNKPNPVSLQAGASMRTLSDHRSNKAINENHRHRQKLCRPYRGTEK